METELLHPQPPLLSLARLRANYHHSGLQTQSNGFELPRAISTSQALYTSEVTKYHHVIKSLTSDFVSELEDVLDDQSTADNYTALKAIILERFTSTTEEKLRRLVSQEAMGDRTPSQFLRHLQTLSDKNAQDKLLRTLWVDKLPPQLQTVVAHHPDLALADVAIGRKRARRAQDAAPPM
jgi:hypothetical protein